MTLKEVRRQFVQLSGRRDLVKDEDDWEDNGADFFIKAGQRLIDTLLDTPNASAVYPKEITSGDYKISVPEARAITSVYIENSDGVNYLIKKNPGWMRETYGDDSTIKNSDKGEPRYYTFITFRTFKPNEEDLTAKGLMVLPRADGAYTLNIEGKFYSIELTKDKSRNFWTEEYPQTLIQAAMYSVERFYRNTQGMQDHMNALMRDLHGIDRDVVEGMIADIDQMYDSFDVRDHIPRQDYGFGNTRLY